MAVVAATGSRNSMKPRRVDPDAWVETSQRYYIELALNTPKSVIVFNSAGIHEARIHRFLTGIWRIFLVVSDQNRQK